jgi:hypothetical protein
MAFGGFPVSREFRFFANKDGVLCYHPYWPKETIKFYGIEEPRGWRKMLNELNRPPEELEALEQIAVLAAIACSGDTWSVDLAKDKTGKWWLTDMAVAADSFHWESCPNRKMQIQQDLITGETWAAGEKPMTTLKPPELLPCPFCGAECYAATGYLDKVWCGDPDCPIYLLPLSPSQWSRRSPSPEGRIQSPKGRVR